MSKSIKRQLLSIIVPCYNEEKCLSAFHQELIEELEKLNKEKYDYQVILVNDGSHDKTLDLILQLAEENTRIQYISFSRNFGKEAAMLAALEATEADCAVIMDADLQHPPQMISAMLEKYEEGYDQVIGKRDRTGDPRKSTFFAKAYYRLVNRFVDVKLVDGAGDFRLMSRSAIDAIASLKETNRFSKGLFTWVGFNQIYLDYKNQQRKANFPRLKALIRNLSKEM